MIIFNEYKYVQEIMESHIIPKNMSIKKVMFYIAKYYYNDNFSVKEFKKKILEEIKKFDLPQNYQEYKYETYIKNLCTKLLSGELSHELKEINSINIYKSEIDCINKCDNDRQKKLLFTLYVLAKIKDTNGWVNYELKDIFALANITATTKVKASLIYELYSKELIQQSQKIDVLGYKVELGSKDEDIIMKVTSFSNLGNQYLATFKPGWKMCECCGRMIKIKGANSKYCKICSREKELEKYNRYNEKR